MSIRERVVAAYRAVERWVHRTEAGMRFKVLTGLGHLVICLVGVAGVGGLLGGLMLLMRAPRLAIDGLLGALMLIAITLYGAREERNRREKGSRQAARDGDGLIGPDFFFAVVGSVAGFTIARALLGL